MKRRICAGLLAIVSMLALSGCGTNDSTGSGLSSQLTGAIVKLPNGEHVTCVSNSQNDGSGVSCDWDHAE